MNRPAPVVDLPRYPPGAVVGDAATRTLLALVAYPDADLDQLADRLNGQPWEAIDDNGRTIRRARWDAARVEANLEVLARAGLVALIR